MFIRFLYICCILFVSYLEILYAAHANLAIKDLSFSFRTQASEISNLMYQLDCLAGGLGLPCSTQAYREL